MRKPTISIHAVLAGLLLLLGSAACGSAAGHDPADAPRRAATTVEVQNNNWLDMVVYVVRSGARVRLGMVTSMSKESFRVPDSAMAPASSLHLEAHPIGSNQSFVAPPVQARPGQRIDLTIQNHLAISSVTVW